MLSSVGFDTIYETNECKFEYSSKKQYLRKTIYRHIGNSTVEKIGEEIYKYVNTDADRSIIKNIAGKWIPYLEGRMRNITVYEHVDCNDFITGWYRTIRKEKKSDGSITNWVRYYRRVGVK